MNAVEPMADAVTGGILGGAIEPATGRVGADGHTTERACLNCGTPLAGDFCHACGQRAHVHRSLHAFAHDLLHGAFHFEGKVWRTLPMLAWRPGDLTRRYIEGQRASFVSPVALFLFSVFLMFAVVNSIDWTGALTVSRAELANAIAKQENEIRALEQEQSAAAASGTATSTIDARLAAAREEAAKLRKLSSDSLLSESTTVESKVGWINQAYLKAKKNPELLFFKLKTNAYKYSWMLIPLSVPLMWLLFPFSRRFRLYDHTVFVTYSLSFMTLLAIAVILLAQLRVPGLAFAMLIPPIHMYRQLKGAYGLTRLSALWRTILLGWFAAIAAGGFMMILLMLGIF